MPRRYREKAGRQVLDSQILHGDEREKYGVTVTITNGSAWKTFVCRGKVGVAMTEAAEKIDAMDGDWKITSISTPNTIYKDLSPAGYVNKKHQIRKPESLLLGRIKRMDLLA